LSPSSLSCCSCPLLPKLHKHKTQNIHTHTCTKKIETTHNIKGTKTSNKDTRRKAKERINKKGPKEKKRKL
jgi:hypothetical protein